jgi:hypothetical protein
MAVSRKSIDDMFQELFGRNAKDEGAAYWIGEVESGKVQESDLRETLIACASAPDLEHYKENVAR